MAFYSVRNLVENDIVRADIKLSWLGRQTVLSLAVGRNAKRGWIG